MYQLYYDKDKCIIQLKKLSRTFNDVASRITDEVMYYNNCYYFCKSRVNLKKKAEELKNEWLAEAVNRVNKVNDIKL